MSEWIVKGTVAFDNDCDEQKKSQSQPAMSEELTYLNRTGKTRTNLMCRALWVHLLLRQRAIKFSHKRPPIKIYSHNSQSSSYHLISQRARCGQRSLTLRGGGCRRGVRSTLLRVRRRLFARYLCKVRLALLTKRKSPSSSPRIWNSLSASVFWSRVLLFHFNFTKVLLLFVVLPVEVVFLTTFFSSCESHIPVDNGKKIFETKE